MTILTNLKPLISAAAIVVVLATLILNFWKGFDSKKLGANLIVGCIIVAFATVPEKMATIGTTLLSWFGL
jgi:hypothetical protein